MSASVQRLYGDHPRNGRSVPHPDTPAPAYRFVELAEREFTYAVYTGTPPDSRHLGYVRHDEDGRWVARTTGSSTHAADVRRNFASRDKAAEWLRGAVNGVRPRVMTRRAAR